MKKLDSDALSGIIAKVRRAYEHGAVLKAEMDEWTKRGPYEFVPEMKANGTHYIVRLNLLEPIPPEWSVIMGEAVHDLRSALDHCVNVLTIDLHGREFRNSQFPMSGSRTDFFKKVRPAKANADNLGWAPDGGMYGIRGIGPGPQAFIEWLQPYPQRRRAEPYYMRVLHEFWNQDKHRLVHLWGLVLSNGQTQTYVPPGVQPPTCWPGIVHGWILRDGAIAMKLICDAPCPQMKVRAMASAAVAMKSPIQYRSRSGSANPRAMFDVVANAVAHLLGAIGNPDATIDGTVEHPALPLLRGEIS